MYSTSSLGILPHSVYSADHTNYIRQLLVLFPNPHVRLHERGSGTFCNFSWLLLSHHVTSQSDCWISKYHVPVQCAECLFNAGSNIYSTYWNGMSTLHFHYYVTLHNRIRTKMFSSCTRPLFLPCGGWGLGMRLAATDSQLLSSSCQPFHFSTRRSAARGRRGGGS